MNAIKRVTSLQNPTVKKYLSLREKGRERKKTGQFVLEGKRELELALKGNYVIDTVLVCIEIIPLEEVYQLLEIKQSTPEILEISLAVYRKLVVRKTTEGIIAILKTKIHSLEKLSISGKNPLILVAESPEKPGNLGALLRTADAANIDAVLIANPIGDLYNPNVIRSSVGCIFTVPVAIGTTQEIIEYLNTNKISIYAAALTASISYDTIDYTKGTAIAVGTEATGLTDDFLNSSKQNILIPMEGEIDSMNVSVSAAIIIFEAKRQRNLLPAE